MTTIDELRQPVSGQEEIDAHSAAVLRATAFPISLQDWFSATIVEDTSPYGPDMTMVTSAWGTGYVARIATDGKPYVLYRSVPGNLVSMRRVYGLAVGGAIEYAGLMHSQGWWKHEARRSERAERGYRHDGLYRRRASRRYGGTE